MSEPTVWRWWDRFLEQGACGILRDDPRRRGRKPISEEKTAELIELAMPPPPAHAGHWTLLALAGRMGIAVSIVFAILKRSGLKPHRAETFKASRDPKFEEKIRDVVGLYVDPPDHAAVISVDEKTQIQVLGRTQAPLPMTPGHPETRTHDCNRNGTACLMAALDVATGEITGQMFERNRSKEFLAFLDLVAEGIEPGTDVRVILDNVSSHKSAMVNEWLKDRPNWTFQFTLAPASWTNAVESFFSMLSTAEAEAFNLQLGGRVHRGDRGLHRASQCQRRPPVPLEQEARGSRRGVEEGAPEAARNGIVKKNQTTSGQPPTGGLSALAPMEPDTCIAGIGFTPFGTVLSKQTQ